MITQLELQPYVLPGRQFSQLDVQCINYIRGLLVSEFIQ